MYYDNQTFTSLMNEIKPTIILFNENWRNTSGNTALDWPVFLAGILNYTQHCTPLGNITIPPDGTAQWQLILPIELYATNFR